MADFRDYGALDGATAPSTEVNTNKHTQVYDVTHDGADYLPHMNRSFISFSYGGKNIEDFNLITIIENDALQRKLYADFVDNVSDSDVWDGQIYWSTHFNSNNLDLTLFTDGIAEKQLDEFKHYFIAGKIDELILSEHPNRAIMARISTPPQISMLPFEEKIKVKVAGQEYNTSTTLYKGSIRLTFVMDDPFWYSKKNVLDDGLTPGKWINANGNLELILESADALKIIQEDGVPFSGMRQAEGSGMTIPTILFGSEDAIIVDTSMSATGSLIGGSIINSGHSAYTTENNDAGITINDNTYGYFYYAGTAPCYPIITFSLVPTLNENGYIQFPANRYAGTNNYNSITIECSEVQSFYFTTPSIFTAYNQVIDIFRDSNLVNVAWEDVRVAIRDKVKHWAPRQYANRVIDYVSGSTTKTTSQLLTACVTNMQDFLKNNNEQIPAAIFSINCKTGKSIGQFVYRNVLNVQTTSIENVGDMVCSNYLVIKERNHPDDNGYIHTWNLDEAGHPHCCYRVKADCELNNFNLQYKYLYL